MVVSLYAKNPPPGRPFGHMQVSLHNARRDPDDGIFMRLAIKDRTT
ncbi:MAG: hypothetical protein ACD_51C00141G0002, partial [uncultured bacterium]